MAGSSAPVMYWAVCTTLCSALRSEAEQLSYQVVMQPVKDALNGVAVEIFEDLRTHAKSFQITHVTLIWYFNVVPIYSANSLAVCVLVVMINVF